MITRVNNTIEQTWKQFESANKLCGTVLQVFFAGPVIWPVECNHVVGYRFTMITSGALVLLLVVHLYPATTRAAQYIFFFLLLLHTKQYILLTTQLINFGPVNQHKIYKNAL